MRSVQDLPLICALLRSRDGCHQARLRTFPGNDVLGTRGDGICWIEIGGEKRRVEVALHWPDAARALVQPLPERLGDKLPAAVTKLRQFGRACGDFVQGAASLCNCASQVVD
jgi:hypothetical protein